MLIETRILTTSVILYYHNDLPYLHLVDQLAVDLVLDEREAVGDFQSILFPFEILFEPQNLGLD